MVMFPSAYASQCTTARKTSDVLLNIGMSEKMSMNLLSTYNMKEMNTNEEENRRDKIWDHPVQGG